ncbi:reverse transcriptase domain-containing protein [Tanacetum coccineum]
MQNDLKNEEKAALIEVLKSHKRAIAWKLSDIKGIDPEFCTHKISWKRNTNPSGYESKRWTPFFSQKECIESFNYTLRENCPRLQIMIAPDWDLPFELMCDASDFAIGAVLGQQKNKHFQPIHYASKTMTEAQAHYTTTEKELLAVVYGYIKNHKKTVKNGQARTRESEEYKKKPKNKSRKQSQEKSNPQSKWSNHGQQKSTRPKIFHFHPPSFTKVQI